MSPYPTTRERLLESAILEFARDGYRGASVRRICDRARANQGAVSYHFGGKRQLYRAAVRRVADKVAAAVDDSVELDKGPDTAAAMAAVEISRTLLDDEPSSRLILRDLADGGAALAEAAVPHLRSSFEALAEAYGGVSDAGARSKATKILLAVLAPPYLLFGAWPILERAFDLTQEQRAPLMAAAIRSAVGESGR